MEPVHLRDIATEVNLTKASEPPGFEERPNSIYLPLIGRGKAVTSPVDFSMKPHNYVQVVVRSENADAGYLAEFFNSALGHAVRESAFRGSVIPKISKASLLEARVYLPDWQRQLKTIELKSRVSNLLSELRELEDRIWRDTDEVDKALGEFYVMNREERFSDWLDVLPFPLASILWAYHASGGDHRKRYDHLVHFLRRLPNFLPQSCSAGLLLTSPHSSPNYVACEMR